MPKTLKNCFYQNLTFEKMLQAHYRAKDKKAQYWEILRFEMNLENNIVNLINSIKKGTYKIGDYRSFIVKEPKVREIQALPYRDRLVQQWYVEEFIKPYFIPRFIKDSYACITNRGTHNAVNAIQKYMRIINFHNPDYWILKCDVKKFFYSIHPDILYNILSKRIKDKDLLKFSKILIYDKRDKEPIGIPIGNYSSQFFANIYLNELDYFIKHKLHIKYYVRYMDDFVLLTNSKKECKEYLQIIKDFLYENLKLELNHKSRYYPSHFGLNFCGYKIWPTHRLLRTNSKKKIKRKVATFNKLWSKNQLDLRKAQATMNSWFAHASHCNSYKLQQNIIRKSKFIFSQYTKIEP